MAVVRRDDGAGGKTFRQHAIRTDESGAARRMSCGPANTCLYRMPELSAAVKGGTAKILIVEGEKCADAAQDALGDAGWVATTWPGGSAAGAIRKCGT